MDIIIDKLFIELTRNCNQACKHCMRGNAQNVSLSKDEVDAFFENNKISEIKTLSFTGGEPFLNKDVFIYILQLIKNNNIKVLNFSCATNGLIFDEEVINVLKELKINGTNVVLFTSMDQFHIPISKEILIKFIQYPFYYYNEVNLNYNKIINIGYAKESNMGNQIKTKLYLDKFYNSAKEKALIDIEDNKINVKNIYMSALGKYGYIDYCDATYDMIDEVCNKDNSISLLENIELSDDCKNRVSKEKLLCYFKQTTNLRKMIRKLN